MKETQDFKIGNTYTSKEKIVKRTLLEFSECKKYGYFKCESNSRTFNRWIFLNAWGCVTRMIEIELQ